MSRIEDGNFFVKRFSRVALTLSLATSSVIFADQNISVNINNTNYLNDGETNTSIGEGVSSNGKDARIIVDTAIDVQGAIQAGEVSSSTTGDNSMGTAIGLDLNDTTTSLSNLGTIGATANTVDFYTSGSTNVYPDRNNTELNATGVSIEAAMTGGLNNTGSISATATLNNDTNNSSATAAGVHVNSSIETGILNTGSITAIASTHDEIGTSDGGNYTRTENRLVAAIGGKYGNGGIQLSTTDLGEKAKYTSTMLSDMDAKVGEDSTVVHSNNNLSHTAQTNSRLTSDTRRYDARSLDNNNRDNYADQSLNTDDKENFNDQYHIANSTGQHQKDKLQEKNFILTDNGGDNNSHMHIGEFTESNLGSPADLDNIVAAAGIKVDADIRGGIINHNYISSVITDGGGLIGTSNGNEVGLTVTPNTGTLAGANIGALDPTATVPATPADPVIPAAVTPAPTSGGGATGSAGGETYATPTANNGTLPKGDSYADDTLTAIKDAKAIEEAALPAEPTDAEIAAVKLTDAELEAIAADIKRAYETTPDLQTEIDTQITAGTPAPTSPATPPPVATAGAAPTDGFKDGVHSARIGNTILNADTAGGTNQGILVRASSATNISEEINATTGTLAANSTEQNARVTSGTVSAYLGEGVQADGTSSRVITRAGNRLTNDLIGGLENNGAVTSGDGFAGMTFTSDATAVADRATGIAITQYVESNSTATTYHDIVSNPSSIVGVGTLYNTSTITGGAGGAGLEVLATSTGGISAADSNISGKELLVSPTAITNIREVINTGDITGGMGGNAINGKAIAIGSITATDINVTTGNAAQIEGITVRTHADATMGNFFNSATISQALGEDGMKMEADGSSTLTASTVSDSTVNVQTTSVGGIRSVYGKDGDKTKLTEGNLLNAGTISASLSAHAVNMHAEGLATAGAKTAAGETAIKNSDINISNETITGVEGNFVNMAWTPTNETTLERGAVQRGSITAALSKDAIHLTANGKANLDALSLENSTVDITNTSTSGVGKTFANYGTVSVSLAENGANFSSTSTTSLGKADTTTITAGITTVTNISHSGVGGDFINGASAIETGTLNEANTTVHNPLQDYTTDGVNNPTLVKEHDGYYEVAANINDTNSSDTNSSGEHANDLLAGASSTDAFINQLEQVTVHAYDKEASITSGTITSALAKDAVKFESIATGDLKVVSIGASTLERIDTQTSDSHHDVFDTKATVTSISISDSSIAGNFVNNGTISVALAAEGINGTSTATGTLGSSGDNNAVSASTVTQYTASRAGVQGDFINEAVSREVGAATVFTAQSGAKEIGAFTYGRATNIGQVAITSALAKNAVKLESHAANLIDLKDSSAAAFVQDNIGSGVTNGQQTRNLSGFKALAGATRSDINSTTTSIAGVGGDFSNTGTISAALAKNSFDALADGTNDLGTTGFTSIKGSNVIASMSSVAGVQGDFTNDIQSLKDGSATLIQRDVYTIDSNNAATDVKYYDHTDAKEGERVKSNVVDRVVYDRALAQGEITAALAADAINLDATGTTNILADYIGVSNVEVVTNHTGYTTASENNVTQVDSQIDNAGNTAGILDSDRIIKVTSEHVQANSVVIAGIGGQFTNRNIISTSLAKNALTAMGTATTTLGQTGVTTIEGGFVEANTVVISGIGNDANTTNREGFLNAAGTYDVGAVQVGNSKIISTDNTSGHLILASNANDSIADNQTALHLINSEDVVFWNRQAPIVASMSASLAKDVVKVDAVNAGSVVPTMITAAMGDVNVTTIGDAGQIVSVVGEHVEGTARAHVSSSSTVIAGINGGLTNQGAMTASLAGNVVMAQADGTGILGDASTTIKGSTVDQNTNTVAGIQDGDFVNETLSFETDNGTVVTTLVNGVETATVVFDRATTNGQVVMSTALAKTVAQLESLSDNKVGALLIEASSGVKYTDAGSSWELNTIFSSAQTGTSDINSSTTSVAGVSGNFYNSGKIDVALAKDAIDAIADSKNALGAATTEIKGSNVTAASTAISGIRGNFTNDVVTLDDGAKHIVQRDVLDSEGNPVYYLSGTTTPGDRVKSNVALSNEADAHHETNAGHGITQNNNSVDGIATDGAVYAQVVVEGEIGVALAGDAIKVDATGTNNIKPLAIKEAEVTVVNMDVQTGTKSNEEIHATGNRILTVDVTSNTTATTVATAGIGGQFTNRSSKEIKTALAKNAITAISTATTTWGDGGVTEVQGGTHTATTLVVAGIGNGSNVTSRGFQNLADSYNEAIHTGVTTQVASNNVAGHALNADNANLAIATDSNNSLALIDSAEVVYWDNKVVVGKISTSLAKDALNLEGFSTGNLTPKTALAVVNDVNVSDSIQAVAGYHVSGTVGANIKINTTSIAGINGGFLNEGEISTSLAGNVVNVKGTATGTVGDVGNTIVVGSTLDGTTVVVAGIQNGDFNNTVKSLDAGGATVVTVLDENGKETPKVAFTRETTDGKVKLAASLAKDVVLLDVSAINLVDAVSIDASKYVMSTAGSSILDAAKSGMSNIIGRSVAIGGVDGNFYNTGIIEASLALNAITTHGTSNNDLGSGALTVHGSNVQASSLAYARIAGDFINDAVLLDTGAPLIKFDQTTEGNTSNVAGSVTYDQALVKGNIKSSLSKDVLSLIATSNNDINLAAVGNTTVKVVSISSNDLSAEANHTIAGEEVLSSNIKADSTAHSGIGGIFINAGTMETALGKDVVNMQAVGGPATITIAALAGGTVEGNNTALSGINLAATSTKTFGDLIDEKKYTTILPAGFDLSAKKDDIIGFLNDKRDFNTLLESDTTSVTAHTTPITGHDAALVATGTIKTDLAQVAINMLATGGVTTTITADAGKIYTTETDANSPYGTATVSNVGNNNVVIQGDFVNLGDIKTGTAGNVLNMVATNEATTDLGTLTADTTANTGGLVLSTAISNVNSYINGDIINTGEMSSGAAGNVLNMVATGGVSAITATMADANLTEWAANNGKVVATSEVSTRVGAGNLFNSGVIKSVDGIAINLTATGSADSSAFAFTNTDLAGNAIVVNHVESNASILNVTNIGTIKSATANAIQIHATGSAIRISDVSDINKSSYEDTSTRVNASVGDIKNIAYTRQNALWEVHNIFNTDDNASTDDQLRPTEDKVVNNLGEYDLTSGAKIDSNASTYSTESELDRLAYGAGPDVNTSAPILSQTIGVIKSGAANAIDIIATATESNSTLVTASAGHILNSGLIDASAAGIGINIKADGAADAANSDVHGGAKAVASVGVIANLVTDDTFKISDLSSLGSVTAKAGKDDVIHAILQGEILGATAGIKLDAVDAGDKDVSVATADQIVNYRRVLNQGDYVISSAGADTADGTAVDEAIADGKVANNGSDFTTVNATRVTQNYGITQLTVDGVYNAVIGQSAADASSIIVGENAHVTDGILNYGELKGKVQLGDADLYLYGLVQNSDHNETFGARAETDEMGLTDNYFAVTDGKTAYIDAETHVQVAGMITTAANTDPKVTNAVVGSNISFDNSHILKGGKYEADHITISSHSIVNIDDDTTFVTQTAAAAVVGSTATNGDFVSNPFDVNLSEGVHNMFTNSGYLNVRAGKIATVTGNYEQTNGYFVTNVNAGLITAGDQANVVADNKFGQLDVSGNADLSGGILVMIDDVGADGTGGRNLDADTTAANAETRLVDVVKANTLSVDGTDLTHSVHSGAADSTAADLLEGVKIQDNSRVYDFEVVKGTTAGGVSLRIAAQDPNAAEISIDTTNIAISAIKSTTRVIAARVDTARPFAGTPRPVTQFTSTVTNPIATITPTATVSGPVGTGTVAPTTPTGGGVVTAGRAIPDTTVLSQGTQTAIAGDMTRGTGSLIQPSLTDYEIAKGMEIDANPDSKLNLWAKMFYNTATQDGESASGTEKAAAANKTTQLQVGRAGYTANTYGLVAGADKQYGEWFIGTAVALAKSTATTSSGPSTTTDTTMLQVTEYGSHPAGKGRINVQAGYAYLNNDKNRVDGIIGDGQGSDGQNYDSKYDGYAINAALEYEQGFAVNSDTTLIPYVGVSGTYVNNDGYTEKGDGSNAQEVSGADSSALIVGVGTRAQYKLTENSSVVGNVGIGYDMIAERVDYEARTALNANSNTLHIEGAKPEALEYEAGLGYQFVTPSNTVIRASVDYVARDGYKDTTGSVKFYFPF